MAMRTVNMDRAKKGIFLGDYTKTRFSNLNNMSSNKVKGDNYDIAQKAGTLKDNLIVGHSIKDRQITFNYKIVQKDGKNYIEIVDSSDQEVTVPACYFVTSKSAIINDDSAGLLLPVIKSVGSSTKCSEMLPKLFEKGRAFFLNSPEFNVKVNGVDDVCSIVPDQVVSNNVIGTLLDAINKRSKRSWFVDGPRSEFYCRCKGFENGKISIKRYFKYNANKGQSLKVWESVIEERAKKKPKNEEGNPANEEGNPAKDEGNPAKDEGNPAKDEGNPAKDEE